MKLDRKTATRRLTNRWIEQVERYPNMRGDVPLQQYIAANIGHLMRGYVAPDGKEPLQDYDRS